MWGFFIAMQNDLFTINGQFFKLSEADSWTIGNDYVGQTLKFIKQWLSGQERFVLQTSGSTGVPKDIEVSRTQMQASAQMTIQFLGLKESDRALICLNTAFIAGKMMIVRSLEHGLKMTIISPSSNPFEGLNTETKFDFVALVPTQVSNILGSDFAKYLNNMKAIIVGGGAVSYSLKQQIQSVLSAVYSTYGMTETVSHIALQRLNGDSQDDYYRVFEGVEIGQDERGCIHIKSILTQNQLLQTNDVVEIVSANTFLWLGRADNVVNSGGIKIHLEQLEAQIEVLLFELKIKNSFFTAGIPDDYWGQKLVLLIEGQISASIFESLKESLAKNLNKYNQPKEIIFCTNFVYTATSKINRNASLQSVKN